MLVLLSMLPFGSLAEISSFDTVGPVLQQLPDFLAETQYADITQSDKTALQKAFNTELPGFIWFPNHPERFGYFQQLMTVQRAGAVNWLSVFPFQDELGDFQGKTVFVDIGGGFGHQSLSVKEAFPSIEGKIVLQDLPQTLEHVPPMDGIEVMPHNFFEPQVVKGNLQLQKTSLVSVLTVYNLFVKLTHPNRCQILLPSQRPTRLAR